MQATKAPGVIRFGVFEVDLRSGELRRSGLRSRLPDQSFQILAMLLTRAGEVVSREEIRQKLWPNDTIVEFDQSINGAIKRLRQALNDSADNPRYVETLARRGYRFKLPVQLIAQQASFVLAPVQQETDSDVAVASGADSCDLTGRTISHYQILENLRSRRALSLAAVILLLIAGFLVWRVWRVPEAIEPLRAVPLITLPGLARYPSFSPEGTHLAFSWTGPKQDNPDIYVQQIGSGSPLRLTHDPGTDYNPVWSPDGRSIAFLRREWEAGKSELRLIPPLGGPERKIAEILVHDTYFILPPYLTWCPDSNCLVVADSPGEGKPAALFMLSLDTGERRQLTHPQPPATGDTNPAVSPDGNWLVFRRHTHGRENSELYRLRLKTGPASGASAAPASLVAVGEPQRLTSPALNAGDPTWMPGNKEILFSASGSLWRQIVVGKNPGENLPERLPFIGEDGLMPVVSRSLPVRPPRLVYVRSFQDTNIWRVETSAPGAPVSAPPVIAISSTRRDSTPHLSPDGHHMVFVSDRSGSWEIWVADLDGSNAVQLTFMNRGSGAPRWSPDGERIVYQAYREVQPDVYVIPAAGGKPRNLTSHPASDWRPSFSRDGKWIYFTSNRTGERRIWKMPASGGDAVQVTNDTAFAAFESPDGAYLYYNQAMDTPSPLWRLPTSGGVPVKVLDGVVLGAFAVLDRGIYYIDRPSGGGGLLDIDRPSGTTRLQYFDLATRRSTTVARNLGNVFLGLTASSDGRTIFYSRVDSSVDDLMLVENFQ